MVNAFQKRARDVYGPPAAQAPAPVHPVQS